MKASDVDVIWSQDRGTVRVKPRTMWRPDANGEWARFTWVRRDDESWSQVSDEHSVLLLFNRLVLFYDIDPKDAHEALLCIDEYRAALTAAGWETI